MQKRVDQGRWCRIYFFVDDSLIFGEATGVGATNVKSLLKEYKNCSGQLINFDKPLVYCSSNVSSEDR